jgi:hypothetical protein
MTKESKTLPRWVQWSAGLGLMSVAVTAGGLSLVLNVSHGLEAGIAAAVAFGLGDTGKIIIPIVAGAIGWSRQMKITSAICVAVSLWCAVNYYADYHGRDLLTKQHEQQAYGDKAKAIAELESEVSRLTKLANEEAKKGGCGKNCKTVNDQIADARKKLAEARTEKAEARPVEISGLATMIAMAMNANADTVARGLGMVKAALFLLLIECLVWLSVPAIALLRQARKVEEKKTSPVVAKIIADALEAKPIRTREQRSQAAKKGWETRRANQKKWTKIDAYFEPAGV